MIQPLPDLIFTFPHAGNTSFTLQQLIRSDSSPADEYIAGISRILKWWYDSPEPLVMTTSGTTGTPVSNIFERDQVIAAARSSMPLIGPPENGTSLLAIHPDYAGGRMLLIRALLAGNHLICVPPMANPLRLMPQISIDYASFVPYQLAEILKDEDSTERLSSIKTVLIGGAAISEKDWLQLCTLPNRIFSTYGMTETLSHVALRRATPEEEGYIPVPGISLSSDARGCLVVESEWLGKIITNDMVDWFRDQEDHRSFIWRGRADTIINSGGILVSPEQIESKLSNFFTRHPEVTGYFITSEPDERLGNRVVLYVEYNNGQQGTNLVDELQAHCRRHFRKEEIPRQIEIRKQFIRTGSGKIDRRRTAADHAD